MIRFYEGLHGGAAAAEALREAQEYVRQLPADAVGGGRRGGLAQLAEPSAKDVDPGHPYFWAPFVAMGFAS